MSMIDNILTFWLDQIGPDGWYAVDEAVDDTIRAQFLPAWQEAEEGAHGLWLTAPRGALAYIILTDQFPRNMFRGDPRSFATDRSALAVAKMAIDRGWDMTIDEPQRQFFYMPLMHSESLCDQDRCVRLMKERMPETGASNLFHAKAHREVIRQFGRFPYRNDALSRSSTAPERAYLDAGGYGETVRQMQQAA